MSFIFQSSTNSKKMFCSWINFYHLFKFFVLKNIYFTKIPILMKNSYFNEDFYLYITFSKICSLFYNHLQTQERYIVLGLSFLIILFFHSKDQLLYKNLNFDSIYIKIFGKVCPLYFNHLQTQKRCFVLGLTFTMYLNFSF